jgi:non-canonical (house-cleaning) NTP pyrophosphatase
MKNVVAAITATCLLTLGFSASASVPQPKAKNNMKAGEELPVTGSFQDSYSKDGNVGQQLAVTGSFEDTDSTRSAVHEELRVTGSLKGSYLDD